MVEVKCPCGEVFHAEEDKAGYHIQCPRCGRIVPIALPGRTEVQRPSSAAGTPVPTAHRPRWTLGWAAVGVLVAMALLAGALFNSSRTTKAPQKSQKEEAPSDPTRTREGIPPRPPFEVPRAVESPRLPPAGDLEPRSPRPGIPRTALSLPNGTDIIPPRGPKGLGRLQIINGTSLHAVVKLVGDGGPGRTRRLVYVQANSETTLKDIGPCWCLLQFSQGLDWDSDSRKFLRNRSYSQFVEPLEFQEVPKEGGVEYSKYEITLHPVTGGKARTRSIDERAFEEME